MDADSLFVGIDRMMPDDPDLGIIDDDDALDYEDSEATTIWVLLLMVAIGVVCLGAVVLRVRATIAAMRRSTPQGHPIDAQGHSR
jgi:hypothetical protein